MEKIKTRILLIFLFTLICVIVWIGIGGILYLISPYILDYDQEAREFAFQVCVVAGIFSGVVLGALVKTKH